MARLPKAATRHDLDRLIIGNQLFIMGMLVGESDVTAATALDQRIQETRDWWRSHYSEDVTVMPALKGD